jgi:hypothetical protein
MSKFNVDTNIRSVISLEFITFIGGLYKPNCARRNYLLLWEATTIQDIRMWRYTQQSPPKNIQVASNTIVKFRNHLKTSFNFVTSRSKQNSYARNHTNKCTHKQKSYKNEICRPENCFLTNTRHCC